MPLALALLLRPERPATGAHHSPCCQRYPRAEEDLQGRERCKSHTVLSPNCCCFSAAAAPGVLSRVYTRTSNTGHGSHAHLAVQEQVVASTPSPRTTTQRQATLPRLDPLWKRERLMGQCTVLAGAEPGRAARAQRRHSHGRRGTGNEQAHTIMHMRAHGPPTACGLGDCA